MFFFWLLRRDIRFYVREGLLYLKVVPNSSKTELIEQDGALKLYLHAVADKNKANLALIKYFKKELGLVVEIKSGLKSREKVLRIIG